MRTALLFTLLPAVALADSPLTSISFSAAYPDLGVLNATRDQQLAFLAQQSAPSDQKLAVMSALGWESGDNATLFVELLAKLRPGDVTPADRFVAGFLLALDDYLALKKRGLEGKTALQLLDSAAKALPDDFSVQYARALVQAQAAPAEKWCDVYRLPEEVKKRFPPAKRNLRPSALEAADGYLHGYQKDCAGSEEAVHEKLSELNQLYSLSRLGKQLVAGTQGGVVVWEPEATKPVAKHEGFICNGITLGAAVWAGCEAEVLRWDGKSFKSYLKRTQGKNSSAYYHPMRGPNGALWVRLGARLWLYDAAADRFVQTTAPWGKKDPYDALVRANSETWWVDFLDALVVDGRRIAKGSAQYPGTDPRRFREDSRGVLWVEDFESGLFRYDDTTKAFVKMGGLDAKGSGIARDEARRRWVMLHYTDGLVLKPDVGAPSKVSLRELDYMRDLLVDENGDIWVAGWNGLMRLRPDGASFGKQRFVVE